MQNDSTVIEIIDLHPHEIQLIKHLRNTFKFGEVTIIMKDGVPFRIKRVMEFQNLSLKE